MPSSRRNTRTLTPAAILLMFTFGAWLIEIPLAAVNGLLLMDRVYTPRVGTLAAHQIAMSTRIVLALLFAYFIAYFACDYTPRSLLLAGAFWMTLWLAFEWGGSLLIGRPVEEILVGWHLERGYMWPYVLLSYLFAPLLVGWVLHPARSLHERGSSLTPRRQDRAETRTPTIARTAAAQDPSAGGDEAAQRLAATLMQERGGHGGPNP